VLIDQNPPKMTNPAKAKGSQFERDVVAVFNAHGYPQVERRYGAGNTIDKGDLNGFAHEVICEVKNLAKITLASIQDETALEKKNAGAKVGIAIIKRRGKSAEHAYAVVTLVEMIELLHAAGY